MKISLRVSIPILVILYLVFSISCTNQNIDRLPLSSDKLYALKNITTSLYKADSATIKSYVTLDTIQKATLITPETIIDDIAMSGATQTYINGFTYAYFISKQKKVGDNLPIIVSVHGDDYSALILILLDKNDKPISHYILSGGFSAGPDKELGDSLVFFHDKQSLLNNDEIITYTLRMCQSEKDTNALTRVDSISVIQKIMPDGNFNCIKKDSTRYYRKYISSRSYW